ncbi:MAG: NAD-dependent epimerase/dehydratase family protein [Isosphaeraceae bacterium]|nr:NAD-dependent epimerase/dehydratase family protein [Isosphaeraceae bacterium]
MRVLVIGGTGFIGPHVTRRLVDLGHEVVIFHRGQTEADLPSEIIHLHGDQRRLADRREEFARFSPEVVVDTRPVTEEQARTLMSTLKGLARRVITIM